MRKERNVWPELPPAWDTYATLHRYLQVVGKVRLALAPTTNHWWHAALHPTTRGFTTSPTPWRGETFAVDFDFIDHELRIDCSTGDRRTMALEARPVAEFYRDFMATLRDLGIDVRINETPVEIPDDVTPFGQDRHHTSYDPEAAHALWRAMSRIATVFHEFRSGFTGKCSPVHLFWGSFDLAVTRFSGRLAPERMGADAVTREAYAEDVSSVGFWPGNEQLGGAAFYSYMAPEPDGFRDGGIGPKAAYYHDALSEFILPYDAVRSAESPEEAVLEFCESTYALGSKLAGWDRGRLERPLIRVAGTKEAAELEPEQPPPGK